jgi:hypothetical protein
MDGEKCGHEQCTCFVDLGEDYCGPHCRQQMQADPDASPHDFCGCHHAECEND